MATDDDDDDDDRIVQKQSQSLNTSHSTKVECHIIDKEITVTYRGGGVDVICIHNHGGFCRAEEEDCFIHRSHERGLAAKQRATAARTEAASSASARVEDDDDDDDDYDDDDDLNAFDDDALDDDEY